MQSTTIGTTTQTILTKRELQLLWIGIKGLQKTGLPNGCVGVLDDDELEELLANVTKACSQHLDTRGPMSDYAMQERIRDLEWRAHLRKLAHDKEQARLARWEKLEAAAKLRRTYDYRSEWRT